MRRTAIRLSSQRLSRSPLPRQSTRRGKENTERRRVVAGIVRSAGDRCEVPGCTNRYDDAHEVLSRARGGSITDPANIRLVCRTCHDELTNEAPWGYALGFLLHSWDRRTA